MTKEAYLEDNYKKESTAIVKSANDKFIVLDESIFYPESGGQPADTGKIIRISDGEEFLVQYVKKISGEISLQVDKEGLKEEDKVECIVDWDRRYLLMRYHTAAHLLSGMIFNDTGAKITGNQLTTEKGRIDFDLEEYDKEKIMSYEQKANEIIQQNPQVEKTFMPREEALAIPTMVKLANALPPSIEKIRVVKIPGVDTQACGGTHINQLKEIGKIKITKIDNKGKNNRRLYFQIE